MSSPIPSVDPSLSVSAAIDDLDTFTRLFLLIIVLALFIRVCYIYLHGHIHISNNNTSPPQYGNYKNTTTGLPIDIINSYHTFPYTINNVATVNINDHDTTCSICISDYKESEMLRMMPQCRHCFHRDCVDTWLKVNGSCPICRNSPLQDSDGDSILECV